MYERERERERGRERRETYKQVALNKGSGVLVPCLSEMSDIHVHVHCTLLY